MGKVWRQVFDAFLFALFPKLLFYFWKIFSALGRYGLQKLCPVFMALAIVTFTVAAAAAATVFLCPAKPQGAWHL